MTASNSQMNTSMNSETQVPKRTYLKTSLLHNVNRSSQASKNLREELVTHTILLTYCHLRKFLCACKFKFDFDYVRQSLTGIPLRACLSLSQDLSDQFRIQAGQPGYLLDAYPVPLPQDTGQTAFILHTEVLQRCYMELLFTDTQN